MAELKKLQENGVDIYPVTLEDVVFDSNGNSISTKYQTKTDDTLNTTDKTIVGAINELFQSGTNAKQNLVDTLVAKGISASTSMTFDELINLINGLGGGDSNNLPNWYKEAWIKAKPLPIATHGMTASSVGNKIYVINARTGNTTLGNCNYCYDVETNTWEEKANITTARIYASSATIGNNIYVIGGNNLQKYINTNECYNTLTNTWSAKANMLDTKGSMACSVSNNTIYCIGGWTSSLNLASNNLCYDPLTDTWSTKAGMITQRGSLASSTVDNKIYCIGGDYGYEDNQFTNINECYDTLTNTWSTKANMITSRSSLKSEVINNKIYCIGGYNAWNSIYYALNECYDPSTDTWESKTDMPIASSTFGLSCIDNMIFCIGGGNSTNNDLDTNYCYVLIKE